MEDAILRWPRPLPGDQVPSNTTFELHDLRILRKSLARNSHQLFKDHGSVKVMACKLTRGGPPRARPLKDHDDAQRYIDEHLPASDPEKGVTNIFIFGQLTSQSALNISQGCFDLIGSRLRAMPKLAQHITAFKSSILPLHEGRSMFDHATTRLGAHEKPILELCALLQYVAPNNNTSNPVPWSIRRMLLYQQYDAAQDRETVLLVRASEELRALAQERLVGGARPNAINTANSISQVTPRPSDNDVQHWTYLPSLVCSTLNSNWLDYLEFMEREAWALENSTTFINPFTDASNEKEVEAQQSQQFESLRKGHDWATLLIRAAHVLQGNMDAIEGLVAEVLARRTAIVESTAAATTSGGPVTGPPKIRKDLMHIDNLLEVASRARRESSSFLNHVTLIRTRVENTSAMVRDCINTRTAHHAALESNYMHGVSDRSLFEAQTVRVIAIVTLIYLPATFTATFFGMQYLQVDNSSGSGWNITASPDIYFYLAITLPLMLLTLSSWWVWYRIQKASRKSVKQATSFV